MTVAWPGAVTSPRWFSAQISTLDQRGSFVDPLAHHTALAPLGVPVYVETAAFDAQPLEEGVVAHPVGEQRAHPRHSLGAVVVGPGHTHRLGHRVPQMADAGVLQPAPGLGVAKEMVGMAQRLPQQHPVGAGAAGAHQERAHVLEG